MIDKIKRDTEINWNKAINFIPKKDEIIIYDFDDGPKVKIGDGIHKVSQLDFCESILKIEKGNLSVEDNVLILKEI